MMFVHGANKSILTDKFIHKHEYEITMNNEFICDIDTTVLFLIITGPKSFENRQLIRTTWGSVKIYNNAKFRLAFVVGQLKLEAGDIQIKQKLQNENNRYQDIVQGNFIDSYKNLTYKTVFGLHWVQKYCRNAQFIFKVDDDVIINVFRLVDFLQRLRKSGEKTDRFVYCHPRRIGTPYRNITEKGYVTFSEYSYPLYPDYCHGGGYLMSSDVALDLYRVTKIIPYIKFEDVYIGFGMNLLELQIPDDQLGLWFDMQEKKWYKLNIYNEDKWYKPVELCMLKHLGMDSKWSKAKMLANWERIVSLNENNFKYFIYLMVTHISIVIPVLTLSACAVSFVVITYRRNRANHKVVAWFGWPKLIPL